MPTPCDSIEVKKATVARTPQYDDITLANLGLRKNDWGIVVILEFSADKATAKKSRASDRSSDALYLHQYLKVEGSIWNEEGTTQNYNLEVSEYFRLKHKAGKFKTAPDKQNNFWRRNPLNSNHFLVPGKGENWCGLSYYVESKLRVGRLFGTGADGKPKPFKGSIAFDTGAAVQPEGRGPVGVPKGGVPGVTDIGSGVKPPTGGLTFKPDPLFRECHYQMWVFVDDCLKKRKRPPPCVTPPERVITRTTSEWEIKETRTVGGPPPKRKKKNK